MRRLSAAVVLLLTALVSTAVPAATPIQKVVTPGGITAWLVEDRSVPVLSMSFTIRGGAALDPEGREGLATMVSSLLDEGAGDLDSQAFQKRLADLSISLDFGAGRDSFGGRLATLTQNRDEAFRLLGLALTEPRFDTDAVERIRGQIRQMLSRRATDPNSIAFRTWYRIVFPDHPYGRTVDGTPETVAAITVDDLRGFVDGRLARDDLIVGVAGDIAPAELAPLLDSAFARLPSGSAAAAVPATRAAGAGSIVVVELPVPQSVAVFGHGGFKRDDPDWYAALVLNYVLGGGGFNSRLMQEVRVKRGLAYSVDTFLHPLDEAGLLVGTVASENARIAESLDIVRSVWGSLAAEGVTDAELAGAKTYLNGSFPISLDSTARIAGTLVAIQRADLGIDYLDRRDGYIDAVTQADIRRVAARMLDTGALSVVVVGRPDGVVPNREPPGSG